MFPTLQSIDHVHINVADRAEAESWYRETLGFRRVDELMEWATPTGPLTIERVDGAIHLALFESANGPATDAVAFRTTGTGFLEWKGHLERYGLSLRVTDHRLAYSLYFSDPWGNQYEITTYDHDEVARRLVSG